jgi:hypothetical protein
MAMRNTHSTRRNMHCVLATLIVGAITVAASFTATPSTAADSKDPLANYRANVLACLNTVTKATCYIWFGDVWNKGDNKYLVMWDRGVQTEMPTVGGNYRLEGREGDLSFKNGQICLKPQANASKQYRTEAAGELYAGAGCYEFVAHQVGDKWTQKDSAGRELTFWLLQGR